MKNGISIMTSLMKHQWKQTRKLVRVQGKNALLLFVAFTMAVPPQLVNQAFGAAAAATTQSGTGAASQLIKGAIGTGEGSPDPHGGPSACCECKCSTTDCEKPDASCDPIGSRFGNAIESIIDLKVEGPAFEWELRRTYSSDLTGSTAVGSRWMTSINDIRMKKADGEDSIEFIQGANSKLYFLNAGPGKIWNASGLIGPYTNPQDSTWDLYHNANSYILVNKFTKRVYFFEDYATGTHSFPPGQLKEESSLQWGSQSLDGIKYSYYDGKVSQITTAAGQDYDIDLSYTSGLLSKVEVKDASSNVIKKVEYTRYEDVTSPSSDIGQSGNLVMVKVSEQASGDATGTFSIVKYTHYRHDSQGKIRAVYENAAVQKIVEDISGISTPEDILTKDDTYGTPDIKDFASRGFEYYTSNVSTASIETPFSTSENLNSLYGGAEASESGMIKSETIGSGCSSCGGTGTAIKNYFYMNINGGTSSDQNEVVRITIEDTEDDTGTAVYRTIKGLNETGRLLRKVIIKDPLGSPQYWCESRVMDDTGEEHRLGEDRKPSAHDVSSASELRAFLDPYDSGSNSWTNDTNTLNTTEGMITVHTYNSAGRRLDTRVKKGGNGTAYYTWAADYGDGDGDDVGHDKVDKYLMVAEYSYPTQTTTRADGIKTTYDYTFWDTNDDEVKKKTITLPSISTSQNGSGVATTKEEYYDNRGRLRWTKDGEGYINYYSPHPKMGGQAYTARDVDPASPGTDVTSGSSGNWDSWTVGGVNTNKPTRDSGLPAAINLVTKTYYDDQDRVYLVEDESGSKHYTVYEDDRTIQFPYWDSTNSKCLMPIQVSEFNNQDSPVKDYSVKASYTSISTTSSEPTGFSTNPTQGDYVSLTRYTYDDNGRIKYSDRYHDIPSSGDGTLSTNFYRTIKQYDELGRKEYIIQIVSGSSASDRKEQVIQTIYDFMGRIIEVKKGVSGDSAANSHNMTDDYDTYPAMNIIAKNEYDDGGVGDGYVTKSIRYFGTGTNDYTGSNPKRNYRGLVRGVERFYMSGTIETAFGPYIINDINWKGQVTASALYDTAPTWSTVMTGDGFTNYASSTTSNRRTLNETSYDDLGRTYQNKRYKISKSTGIEGNHFLTNNYYNRNGQSVATQKEGSAALEYAYDALGRSYQIRIVLELESTKYSSGKFQYRDPFPNPALSSMTGGDDKVISISHYNYDGSLKIESHFFEANHDDTTVGLDLSNNDDYVRSSVYQWYNDANRIISSANYGSGDTTAGAGTWKYTGIPTRPTTGPTVSSEAKLVTQYSYNSDTGVQEIIADPSGIETKSFFDDMGRTIYEADNYDDFNASTEANTGDSTDKSKDQVTKYVYNGINQVKESVAMDANADGNLADNQSTVYLYEDSTSARLTTSEISPDSSDTTSSGTDQIKFEYNLDGTQKKQTDQRGNIIEYSFNNERKLELSKVTTLGTAVDGHIRSIKQTYDDVMRIEKITSYPNSDGTGDPRNEIQYEYDDLGNLTNSYQSHESTVNTSTTPDVEYSYDTTVSGSVFSNQHRLNKTIYPDGRVIFQNYEVGTADSLYDSFGRTKKIQETDSTGVELAVYDMIVSGRLAMVDLPEPDIKLDYFQGTSGSYAGYDRFGRVKDQYWDGYNSTADVDRIKYGHDYAGNRTYRDIDSSIYAGNDKDRTYSYDGLHRLTNSDEGTLSGTSLSGTPSKEEDWTLDALNNWSGYVTKTSGTESLNQSRTTNDVNEMTNVTESTGPSWVTPAYDSAGNMTSIPKPSDLTAGYTGTYDAWNRLVKLTDGANIIAEYEYDGNNRRILKSIYSSGSLNHRQHFYYNNQWQVLEVRKEVSGSEDTDPLEQYVYHPYYIDAVILRDYDENTDGTSERNYHIQDANFNVTAITDDSGTVLERYQYTPYGDMTVLDSDFSKDADGVSDLNNAVTFTGRKFDIETGLYYYRNRYYHANLGQFISRDPLKYIDGLNLYVAYFVPHGVDSLGTAAEKCTGKWTKFSTFAKIKGDWFLEWGSFSFSWYGISAVKICVNVAIGARGDISCDECCPNKGFSGRIYFGPVTKVCVEIEVPYLAAITLASLMGAPIPGTRLIAMGSIGAFGVRAAEKLLKTYEQLLPVVKAKKALDKRIRNDKKLPTSICQKK